MTIDNVLLCGDPQQPSEYMYESASFLESEGVSFSQIDWKADVSAERFREVTMEMESRGPAAYDTSIIEENLDGVDALVVHKAPVSKSVVEAGEDLQVVGAARGGVENVDIEAARANDVTVLHAPGRNRNAVSDYAVSLLLAKVREIPRHTKALHEGEWSQEFDPSRLPRDIEALTVGIVGFGNIGQQVARRLDGFGPDLLAYDPYQDDETFAERGVEGVELPELLERADAVTLHARLTDETANLLGTEEFAQMRDSAILVNSARGGLVDEDALVDALRDGEIAGAALDVFETEPLPEDHPFLDMENVVLSPHTAGSTRDAVTNGPRIVAEGLADILADEEPTHRVD
ncbi:D-3-phosphoglycerate dehydrogenase [Halopelagius inordinatus]|uniref:D-3-phosphoglycerate dehydrogenase n=1 Tax=Halopelagius inordinatus TaxID=553467 RepID=A0A1I2VDF5_9EURY|nr:2-hydroxyacid dehydrogenase [Halopelagius inordinatus]SFG86509.1 D-3-phosphoglycerate dehydrogenase [Halopelagius inordinatus]